MVYPNSKPYYTRDNKKARSACWVNAIISDVDMIMIEWRSGRDAEE